MTPKKTNDMLANFERFMRDKTKKQLGALLADYFNESNFEGWEGITPQQKRGIALMFDDMMTYWDHIGNHEEHTERRLTSGTTYYTAD